ncbi:MAG: hypothetical protein U1F36_16240 [Planctomycetota bacterium]
MSGDTSKPPATRGRRRLGIALLIVVALPLFAEAVVRFLDLVPVVGPALTSADPVYGKRLKASLRCERRTPWFRMRFTTNSRGWRGPEPREGRGAIVVIGDEAALGYGVDDGLEFPRLLETALRSQGGGAEVADLAIPDSATGRSLLVLRDALRDLSPRAVVLQIDGADFAEVSREGLFRIDAERRLVRLTVPPPSLGRRLQSFVESVPVLRDAHLMFLLRGAIAVNESDPRDPTPRIPGGEAPAAVGDGLAFALLDEIARALHDATCPALIVLTGRVAPLDLAALRSFCVREGFPLVIGPSPDEDSAAYLGDRASLSARGQATIAEALLPPLLPLLERRR